MAIRRAPTPKWKRAPFLLALIGGIAFGLLTVAHLTRHRAEIAHALQSKPQKKHEELKEHVADLERKLVEVTTDLAGAQKGATEVADLKQKVKSADEALKVMKAEGDALRKQLAAGGSAQGVCQDRHTPIKPSAELDKKNPEFAAFLRKIAINNELVVAVSNKNYAWPGGMLDTWMSGMALSGVKNRMVLALDEETRKHAEEMGTPAYIMDLKIPDSQKNNGGNHAVSAMKFRILKGFLELGYAVLLSDVDIVTLQNPFEHLIRDSDVESMSDGWDDQTAYGYNDVLDDPSMGWSRYVHSMRIFVFNSGLFYLRPTLAAMDLIDKVIHRVETENGWDQAIFNEVIFFPHSPRNKDPSVTRRVMDYMKFMNSKVLFKRVRNDRALFVSHKPVMIHVNFHPDKFERMKAIVKRYVDGDMDALSKFSGGSEPGS